MKNFETQKKNKKRNFSHSKKRPRPHSGAYNLGGIHSGLASEGTPEVFFSFWNSGVILAGSESHVASNRSQQCKEER